MIISILVQKDVSANCKNIQLLLFIVGKIVPEGKIDWKTTQLVIKRWFKILPYIHLIDIKFACVVLLNLQNGKITVNLAMFTNPCKNAFVCKHVAQEAHYLITRFFYNQQNQKKI